MWYHITVNRPSVLIIRPSVCPIDRQQQRRAAGLLLSAPRAGNIDRQQAPALAATAPHAARRSAANAGIVMLTAKGRRSTQTCLLGVWPLTLYMLCRRQINISKNKKNVLYAVVEGQKAIFYRSCITLRPSLVCDFRFLRT